MWTNSCTSRASPGSWTKPTHIQHKGNLKSPKHQSYQHVNVNSDGKLRCVCPDSHQRQLWSALTVCGNRIAGGSLWQVALFRLLVTSRLFRLVFAKLAVQERAAPRKAQRRSW